MRKILYTKYNSTRKPEFQIKTVIVQEDEEKYVEKKAMTQEAVAYIEQINKNCSLLKDVYQDVKVVSCSLREDMLGVPYIDGKRIYEYVDLKSGNIERIIGDLKEIVKKVCKYNSENISEFVRTDAFAAFFGECYPKVEPALKIANISNIFDGFIEDKAGELWCVNYDWVLDFPVPIRYLVFRSLVCFYYDNSSYFVAKCALNDFLMSFDYSIEDIELFHNMENAFQQHIYGVNREYFYTQNYKKEITTLGSVFEKVEKGIVFEKELELTKNHVKNLEEILHNQEKNNTGFQETIREQQAYIQKLKRAIKNPFYALYLLIQKLKGDNK